MPVRRPPSGRGRAGTDRDRGRHRRVAAGRGRILRRRGLRLGPCSVPEPADAILELRRVLKPGERFRFYEHVRSRNPLFRGLQRAVDGLFWTRALGGCRTTRDTEAAIRDAGFEIVSLDRGFHSSSVLTITLAPYVLGVAKR
jgi:SAM-dependent methyltransferase